MSRVLAWEGCVNVRDLGGLPTEDGDETRRGSIVRSDDPGRLTEAGWAALREHGIRTVVDLRAAQELGGAPSRLPVVRVALMGEEDGAYLAELAARGVTFADWYLDTLERHAEPVRRALAAVADAPPGGVLVHCVGGKDRTGILAALLLRLAGVAPEDVADDYAATERDAPRDEMLAVLAELDRRGGVEAYLRRIGLDDGRIAALRERLR